MHIRPVTIDAARFFSDPDGDVLTYSTTSAILEPRRPIPRPEPPASQPPRGLRTSSPVTAAPSPQMNSDQTRFQNRFLLVLALGISLLFVVMIRQFLVAILLAAVFSAMIRPLYLRLAAGMGGRERAAAVATLLLALLVLVVPAIALHGSGRLAGGGHLPGGGHLGARQHGPVRVH